MFYVDLLICANAYELYHSAWERYQDLIYHTPYHSFTPRGLFSNFLDGLNFATRSWVEGGTGTTSLHDFTVNEAWLYLEEMAVNEYELWNIPMTYCDVENEKDIAAKRQDLPSPHEECFPELHIESTSISEATWVHEDDREEIQAQHDGFQPLVPIMSTAQEVPIAVMFKRKDFCRG